MMRFLSTVLRWPILRDIRKKIDHFRQKATLVETKCIIHHWQECRSLPIGPELTGEEFFAGREARAQLLLRAMLQERLPRRLGCPILACAREELRLRVRMLPRSLPHHDRALRAFRAIFGMVRWTTPVQIQFGSGQRHAVHGGVRDKRNVICL